MADEDLEKRSPPHTVRDAWMSVLGVFTNVESELHRAATGLLESLGITPDETGRHGSLGGEILALMKKNREEFERRVDEGVRAAVSKVRAPIDRELTILRSRVERLQAKIDQRRSARKERNPPDDLS